MGAKLDRGAELPAPALQAVRLQLVAYELAALAGSDVDKPRNSPRP